MKFIARLMTLELIESLALPANLRYGQAIYKRGAVEFISSKSTEVEAWVGGLDGTVTEGGGQRRKTQLFSTPKGLQWHCAGNPKNHDIFCKHCVALGLFLLKED